MAILITTIGTIIIGIISDMDSDIIRIATMVDYHFIIHGTVHTLIVVITIMDTIMTIAHGDGDIITIVIGAITTIHTVVIPIVTMTTIDMDTEIVV